MESLIIPKGSTQSLSELNRPSESAGKPERAGGESAFDKVLYGKVRDSERQEREVRTDQESRRKLAKADEKREPGEKPGASDDEAPTVNEKIEKHEPKHRPEQRETPGEKSKALTKGREDREELSAEEASLLASAGRDAGQGERTKPALREGSGGEKSGALKAESLFKGREGRQSRPAAGGNRAAETAALRQSAAAPHKDGGFGKGLDHEAAAEAGISRSSEGEARKPGQKPESNLSASAQGEKAENRKGLLAAVSPEAGKAAGKKEKASGKEPGTPVVQVRDLRKGEKAARLFPQGEADKVAEKASPVRFDGASGELRPADSGAENITPFPGQQGEAGAEFKSEVWELQLDRNKSEPAQILKQLREQGFNRELVQKASFVLKDRGAGEIRLVLKPDNLGEVKFRLSLEDNRIAGKIIVENSSIRQVFENNLSHLNRVFRENGYEMSGLDVSVGGRQNPEGREKNGGSGQNPPWLRGDLLDSWEESFGYWNSEESGAGLVNVMA